MSSKVLTIQESESKDQRISVEGSVGSLVSPEAVVESGAATVSAEDSTVLTEVNMIRIQPGDVRSLLDPIFADASEERKALTGLASSALSGAQASQLRFEDVAKATATPEQAQTESLVPVLIIVAVVLIFFVGVK